MATIQEILDKINASKSNNINNNSFIDLMRQISGNPEDATAPVNDTNSIYGHIVQMYTTLYDGGIDYAILADEVDMLQGVYDNLIAINSVYADKTKLDIIYTDKLTLDSLYADKDKLDQLFADKAVIDRVYGSIDNIDRVHTSIDKLDTVYASVLKMDTVADNIADVNTVATNIVDVTKVANIVLDVTTVANNIVDVQNAEENAIIAKEEAWRAEAERLTANSYATEPEDVFVKIYTSNNDSTFTITDTVDYSSYHWERKATAIVIDGIIDDGIVSEDRVYSSSKVVDLLNGKLDYNNGVIDLGSITDIIE